MTVLVSEGLRRFLESRATASNADLVALCTEGMEVQCNVAAGDGEPVYGKKSTYSNGVDFWWNIRIPKDANSEPSWKDYPLTFSLGQHAEAVGMTGWDWQSLMSRYVAFDFDSLMGHAKGITDDEMERVKEAAMQLDYVQLRRSTGGTGLHAYVFFDAAGVPCENHTTHSALARCVLGMMSRDCKFDFKASVDCYGGVMWIWARKMTEANQGLAVIKASTRTLSVSDLPPTWRDKIEKPKKEATVKPPPRHPVEEDYIHNGDFERDLVDLGWTIKGEYAQHPKTDKPVSASFLRAEDGTRLMCAHTTSTALEAGRCYNYFDAIAALKFDGNKEAARAALLKEGYGRFRIPLMTCREFAAKHCEVKWVVPGIMAEGQPGTLGAPKKCMKTSIGVEAVVSIASGTPFLGHFPIEKPRGAIILSGESGEASLKDTAYRVCASKGIRFEDVENLHWCDWLPKLAEPRDVDSLERAIEETGSAVLFIDPAYLCLPGVDAGNLFVQGERLRPVSEMCRRHGVTFILAHHTRKRPKVQNQRTFEPLELDDLTYSGFSEFSRQWWLLNRREEYDPNTGLHRLWFSVGGSAGHGGLWALDIDEGVLPNRHWKVELLSPSDARTAAKGDTVRDKLLGAMREFPGGEVMTNIMMMAGVRPDCRNKLIFEAMVEEGVLVPCEVQRGKRVFPGFKLKV
jgi:hypothetical protein